MENGSRKLSQQQRGRLIALLTVGAAAVAFLLIGAFSGQAREVLNKAIRVCLECIGIG